MSRQLDQKCASQTRTSAWREYWHHRQRLCGLYLHDAAPAPSWLPLEAAAWQDGYQMAWRELYQLVRQGPDLHVTEIEATQSGGS